jgi:RNA polymerase sigma-70 factor (ECF subfamily)
MQSATARLKQDPARAGLAELLGRIADGDKSAFARLYSLTSGKLYGVALRIMRDRPVAEDIVQEAYLRIWRNAASFDPAVASPVTWMASIVRHCAIDALRKRKLETVEHDDESANVAADDIDPIAEMDIAKRRAVAFLALKKLDPEKRKLLLQAYFREKSRDSLAKQHGVPTGTIKTHLRRTLIELRQSILRDEIRTQASVARESEAA